jgi:uncharacterized protein (DUF2267 family)
MSLHLPQALPEEGNNPMNDDIEANFIGPAITATARSDLLDNVGRYFRSVTEGLQGSPTIYSNHHNDDFSVKLWDLFASSDNAVRIAAIDDIVSVLDRDLDYFSFEGIVAEVKELVELSKGSRLNSKIFLNLYSFALDVHLDAHPFSYPVYEVYKDGKTKIEGDKLFEKAVNSKASKEMVLFVGTAIRDFKRNALNIQRKMGLSVDPTTKKLQKKQQPLVQVQQGLPQVQAQLAANPINLLPVDEETLIRYYCEVFKLLQNHIKGAMAKERYYYEKKISELTTILRVFTLIGSLITVIAGIRRSL